MLQALVGISFGLGAASSAVADVPLTVQQTGRLFDSRNKPLEGQHTLTFKLWGNSTAGTALLTAPG